MTDSPKPNSEAVISLADQTIHGARRTPTKKAPPTVKVLRFRSTRYAMSRAAGRQAARRMNNKNRLMPVGTERDPMRIKNREVARSTEAALKKPYHVKFHPSQAPSGSRRTGMLPIICHCSCGNVRNAQRNVQAIARPSSKIKTSSSIIAGCLSRGAYFMMGFVFRRLKLRLACHAIPGHGERLQSFSRYFTAAMITDAEKAAFHAYQGFLDIQQLTPFFMAANEFNIFMDFHCRMVKRVRAGRIADLQS